MRLPSLAPEASASANSATPARPFGVLRMDYAKLRNSFYNLNLFGDPLRLCTPSGEFPPHNAAPNGVPHPQNRLRSFLSHPTERPNNSTQTDGRRRSSLCSSCKPSTTDSVPGRQRSTLASANHVPRTTGTTQARVRRDPPRGALFLAYTLALLFQVLLWGVLFLLAAPVMVLLSLCFDRKR